MGNGFPHVLVVPSWYPSAEIPNNGIFFKEQVKALRKSGLKVGVVYPDIQGLKMLKLKNLFKYRFQTRMAFEDEIPTFRFYAWNTFPRMNKLQGSFWVKHGLDLIDKYIRKYGIPDVIHAHCVLWGGYTAYLASKKYNIPYIITEHTSDYAMGLIKDWHEPYIRESLNNASQVVAVSSAFSGILNKYIASGDRIIEVVPNLVDTDFFALPKYCRKNNPFVFLGVGAFFRNKGFDVLIRAYNKAFGGNPDVLLHIGGDGLERERLEALVGELGLEKKVKFLGYLNRDGVRNAMWNSNAFVHPSFYETFGVVLIEALSTGLPVIATRCGGPEDIVNDKVGKLVEVKNIDEVSNAMAEIYNSQGIYDESLLNDYVDKNFSEEVIVNKLVCLYKGSIEKYKSL